MAKEDVERYIEIEAPALEVIENRPDSLVCYRPGCDRSIGVDPATLVLDDDDAVYIEPEDSDGEKWCTQVFCSAECRNNYYS